MDEPPIRKHMLDALRDHYYKPLVDDGTITASNAATNMSGISGWRLTDIWRHCKRVNVWPVFER